jgi:hypothetical protein
MRRLIVGTAWVFCAITLVCVRAVPQVASAQAVSPDQTSSRSGDAGSSNPAVIDSHGSTEKILSVNGFPILVPTSFEPEMLYQELAAADQQGSTAEHNQSATVWVQGAYGSMRELQVPATMGPLQALVQGPGAVDLEKMASHQAGCPVQIVNASFDRPAEFMLTSHSRAESAPTLRLDYRNFSGKDIESVVLTGWIKVKDNPYQLDSVSHSVALELSRKALLGKDVQATQALKLAANAIGFDRIELSQVTYVNGTTWKAQRKCVYANAGSTERALAR